MKKILAVVLIFLLAIPASSSVLLTATTEILELTTFSTSSTDYTVSYVDLTSSTFTPGSTQGNITTATTTTILSAPAASTQRQVKLITIRNKGTASQTVILKKDISGTEYFLTSSIALNPNETLTLDSNGEYYVRNSGGQVKTQAVDSSGYTGFPIYFYKVGATSEAAGLLYGFAKDSGLPGAWVPGVPGVNGDALSCNTTGDATIAGAPYIPDPASGTYFLTNYATSVTVLGTTQLYDLIWYNTGLTVTTTTAQNITLPTLPNRDLYGANNGEGWNAAIYVTTATTNASAVTNTTLSYTDSDGNTGNTATIASFPATAVAGAFIPFRLAAGDRGIKDIASITLGTSYVTGAISLILYRPIAIVPNTVINNGGTMMPTVSPTPGMRLYNGTCLWYLILTSATTATTVQGVTSIIER